MPIILVQFWAINNERPQGSSCLHPIKVLERTEWELRTEVFHSENKVAHQYPVSVGVHLYEGYVKSPEHFPKKGVEGQSEASPKELRR